MPFKETDRLAERARMLSDFDSGAFDISALCERHGVSRPTFYRWKARRDAGDELWFVDGSHAPLTPHRADGETVKAIVAVRGKFKHFGPKKIRAWLRREAPDQVWPAASTIGDILKREGLQTPGQPRRRRPEPRGAVIDPAAAPNDEWCVDFKGNFLTGDGQRCDPLTLSDCFSRFGLAATITSQRLDDVQACLTSVFRDVGMPKAIRSDNGTPFGSNGAGGLSRLSVWLLRLAVEPHFIPPSSPQDNGRLERFHRTLKAQTLAPPAATPADQQRAFDAFRRHYNEERPHEALDQTPPADHWQPSTRAMPDTLPPPQYDGGDIRSVRSAGDIKWKGQPLFIGEAFAGEFIQITQADDNLHLVRFCTFDIGAIDAKGQFRRFAPLRHRLREAPKPASETSQEPEQLSLAV